MTDRDDASIPTLTIRATTQHEPPVLTEVAHSDETNSEHRHPGHAQSVADQSQPPWDVTPPQRAWAAPASPADPASTGRAPSTGNPSGLANTASPAQFESVGRANSGTPASHPNVGASNATSTPSDAVLRAALQADIEDAVQDALDEALLQVKARLEAELPDIVARAVRRTRLG